MEYSCKCQEAEQPSTDNLSLISQLPTSVLYNCKSCGAAWDYSRREGWDLLLLPPAAENDAVELAEADS